jgi:replicative DNA helicase
MDNLYVLCSDNDIILEHDDDTNNFIMTFNVSENYDNIENIVKENNFFNLLYELNNDIIVNYSETVKDKTNNVIYKIATPKNASLKVFDEHIYLYISYLLDSKNNEIMLYTCDAKPCDNNKQHIVLNNFNMIITKNLSGTTIKIKYSFDNKINDVTNKFLALYIKKIIKKLKQYFDMA